MPRTLAQNAQYIAETIKPAIKSAIEAQGVTVPSTDSFLDYADRIGEIEGGGSGYQLKDLPSGSISTVTDAAPLPLNALKVSVEAWQEGSGDPSPSNIRPIHGWDSATINNKSRNLLTDKNAYVLTVNTGEDAAINVATYNVISGKTYTVSCYQDNYIATSVRNTLQITANGGTLYEDGALTNNYHQNSGVHKITFTANSDHTIYVRFWGHTLSVQSTYSQWQIEESPDYTIYQPYWTPQEYTQQFPTTIYGAEWNVTDGPLDNQYDVVDLGDFDWVYVDNGKFYAIGLYGAKNGGGYDCEIYKHGTYQQWSNATADGICFNVGSTNSIYIRDTNYSDATALKTAITGYKFKYELATPTTIDLSPLSIRLLQGTNNIFADCGEVIDGEYFVDEGAIDVRKVDYQIGSSGSIKTTDGRVLSGFASMSGYHARPLDASGNWLDVDWSKDFEIGVAFKFISLSANQAIFASISTNSELAPTIIWVASDASGQNQLRVLVSADGLTWEVTCITSFVPTVNTFYFVKMKYESETKTLITQVTSDFINWIVVENDTLSAHPYYNGTGIVIGGRGGSSSWATNNLLIDTFNTYIKGDGVNWGASTGAFPS